MGATVPAKLNPVTQILGTRCGLNGSKTTTYASGGYFSRMRHVLPYGGKKVRLVFAPMRMSNDATPPVERGVYLSDPTFANVGISANVVAGGSGYVVGDRFVGTVNTGEVPPLGWVEAVSSGVVTSVVLTQGGLFAHPRPNVAVLATTGGSGTGLTISLNTKPYLNVLHAGLEQVYSNQAPFAAGSNVGGIVPALQRLDGLESTVHIKDTVNGLLVSEPLHESFAANAIVGSRVWMPTKAYTGRLAIAANAEYGGAGTDITLNGTAPATSAGMYCYQPIAIIGELDTPKPSFVFIGTSIIWAQASGSPTEDQGDSDGYVGWAERAAGNKVAWSNFAAPGDRMSSFVNPTTAQYRLSALEYLRPSHVLDEYLANDLSDTFTNIQANKIKLWTMLQSMGVKHIWISTGFPQTTSTDGWATTANQTPNSPANANMQSYNTWILGTDLSQYGVEKVIDLRSVVESSPGSGLWVPNATADGVHPKASYEATIAVAAAPYFVNAVI